MVCNLSIDKLCEDHSKNWPKIADDIFTSTNRNFDKYYSYMSKIKPTEANYQPVHISLIKYFRRIITTNYDLAFENANKATSIWDGLKVMFFPGNLNPLDFQENSIAYIHGHVEKKAFVFRYEEYDTAYNKTNEILAFLRAVVRKNSLLFIGFSFEDKVFKEKLEEIVIGEKQQAETIYKVFEKDNRDNAIQKFYVIVAKKDLESDLIKQKVLDLGIDQDFINKYFDENSNGQIVLKPNPNIDDEFKFKSEPFWKEFQRITNNKDRVKYFDDLGFEIIQYDGKDRTQIEDIINKIGQQELDFTDGLPNVSTTN